MNIQTSHRPVVIVAALLMIMALTSLACSFSGPRLGTVSSLVDITLTQDMFNQIPREGKVHIGSACDPFDNVTRIELHNGFIRFLGTKVLADGTKANGSFDISLGAKDDKLQVEIIAVDIPGMTLEDTCIVDANTELAMELSQMVVEPQGEVLFKEVVVEEGALRLKVLVNIDL